MDTRYKTLRADEIEINISSLIKACLKKIWLIIAITLAVAIMIPSFIYYKDMQNYNLTNENIDKVSAEKLELSKEEVQGIDMYFLLERKIKQLEEYKENSILMKLDFDNVYQCRIQYYVNTQQEIKQDITYAIANYVNNGSLASVLGKNSNFIESKYIQEIISAELPTNVDDFQSGIVSLRILGESQEMCEQYVKEIKSLLEQYNQSLDVGIAESELVLLEENYIRTSINDIYAAQKNHAAEIVNVQSELNNHIATLTETQKAYILLDENNEGIELEIEKIETPSFSITYAIIGAILGVILSTCGICIVTLFNGKIQSSKEIFYRLKLNELGCICNKRQKDKEINELAEKIILRLKDEQIEQVVLVGTTEKILENSVNKIKEIIERNGIKVNIAGDILQQVGALECVIENKNIILVEEIGKTKLTNVYEEVQICSEINARIIGYISIDNDI